MLSVIIPTRDRAVLLGHALESLIAQNLSPQDFEILVVDNGSSDATAAVTADFAARAGNVRYFLEPEPGLHAGRHRGLREARGDLLVFGDDDIRALPTWLAAIAENFEDPSVALVGGNNIPDFEVPPPAWLRKMWQRPAYGGRAIPALSVIELPPGRRPLSPFLVWGCNFSVRRQVVLDCGGFHPDAVPRDRLRFRGDGETHISRHVSNHGLGCVFDSRASVLHAVTASRMTPEYFRTRAFNQGISDSYSRLRAAHAAPVVRPPARPVRALARKLRDAVYGARDHMLAGSELREIARLEKHGHAEGFAFHQAAYRDDPEVRAWVQKPDYF